MMHELILDPVQALPSIPDTGLRRRRGYGRVSVRKNVCLITLNGSWNGFSMWNIGNGFGGF